jgi:NAD(P)H-flavin reductase
MQINRVSVKPGQFVMIKDLSQTLETEFLLG